MHGHLTYMDEILKGSVTNLSSRCFSFLYSMPTFLHMQIEFFKEERAFLTDFSLLFYDAADKEEDSQVAALLPEVSKRKSQKTSGHFYQNPFKIHKKDTKCH